MSGLTIGANTFSYIYTHSMLDTVQKLGQKGYCEFEILVSQPHFWATYLSPAERRDFPKRLADQGLHITSVNWPGIDNNIVSSTREMRQYTIETAGHLVDLCGDWNIPYCILVPGRTMPLWPIPEEQLTEWFVSGMTKLADRATEQGVTMLIENVPTTWIPLAQDVMKALDALGRSDVGIIYDVANAPIAGENPSDGLKVAHERLKLVHLSDTHKSAWRHDPVGMGDIDFTDIFKTLNDIEYSGISMLELITENPDFHFIDSHEKLVEMGWNDFLVCK